MVLSANLLTGTVCFAGSMGAVESDVMHDGLFMGLGGNYNSINITQNSWGKGISNIQTNTGGNTNGIAEGTGAPFHNTNNTFAPEVQAGYFKHFEDTENLYGLKFSYQYLGSKATNSNLYIPQIGVSTSVTGVTSSLFGYVNADSVQVSTNHALTFLAFIGRSFNNKFFYLGGLVSYASPSIWAVGGAAQLGMTYFISPTWFIDASYTYSVTGENTTNHQQTFVNSSTLGSTRYNTSGTLYTKDTLSVSNQALTLAINKVLDF